MTKEQVENLQEAKAAADKGVDATDGRERSTIQFPYNDLDDAATAQPKMGHFIQKGPAPGKRL